MKFGGKLKYCREELAKKSQGQVADDLDIQRTYLSDLERDIRQPSRELLERFAKYYEVDLGYFYDEQEERLPEERELLEYAKSMDEPTRALLLNVAKIFFDANDKDREAEAIMKALEEIGGEELVNQVIDSVRD